MHFLSVICRFAPFFFPFFGIAEREMKLLSCDMCGRPFEWSGALTLVKLTAGPIRYDPVHHGPFPGPNRLAWRGLILHKALFHPELVEGNRGATQHVVLKFLFPNTTNDL